MERNSPKKKNWLLNICWTDQNGVFLTGYPAPICCSDGSCTNDNNIGTSDGNCTDDNIGTSDGNCTDDNIGTSNDSCTDDNIGTSDGSCTDDNISTSDCSCIETTTSAAAPTTSMMITTPTTTPAPAISSCTSDQWHDYNLCCYPCICRHTTTGLNNLIRIKRVQLHRLYLWSQMTSTGDSCLNTRSIKTTLSMLDYEWHWCNLRQRDGPRGYEFHHVPWNSGITRIMFKTGLSVTIAPLSNTDTTASHFEYIICCVVNHNATNHLSTAVTDPLLCDFCKHQ